MVSVATTLPVPSTTATFTPVRKPGSRPRVARPPAGAASSRSLRLAANTAAASRSADCRSRVRTSMPSDTRILVRQAQRTVSSSHRSAGRPRSAIRNRAGDPALVVGQRGVRRIRAGPAPGRRSASARPAPHPGTSPGSDATAGISAAGRSRSSRRTWRRRSSPRRRGPPTLTQPAPLPQQLAQLPDQVGVLAEPLGQDRPGTGQRRAASATPRSASTKPAAAAAGSTDRVADQQVGQRLQPGLPGDLRLGAPLGLERQVDVLEPGLGLGGRRSARPARRSACPARQSIPGPPPGGPRAPAGSPAARSAVRSWASSSEPVASLRYRAMNGTVAPPSSSATAASTCQGCAPSSSRDRGC